MPPELGMITIVGNPWSGQRRHGFHCRNGSSIVVRPGQGRGDQTTGSRSLVAPHYGLRDAARLLRPFAFDGHFERVLHPALDALCGKQPNTGS
jgi:hypothetical protein